MLDGRAVNNRPALGGVSTRSADGHACRLCYDRQCGDWALCDRCRYRNGGYRSAPYRIGRYRIDVVVIVIVQLPGRVLARDCELNRRNRTYRSAPYGKGTYRICTDRICRYRYDVRGGGLP